MLKIFCDSFCKKSKQISVNQLEEAKSYPLQGIEQADWHS